MRMSNYIGADFEIQLIANEGEGKTDAPKIFEIMH